MKIETVVRGAFLTMVSSALLSSVGCGEVPGAGATDDPVAQTSSALSSQYPTYILLTDNRAATNGVLTLQEILPGGYSDSEGIRTTLYPQGTSNQALMAWTSTADRLQLRGFGPGQYPEYSSYSSIRIDDFSGGHLGGAIGTMRITMRVYITGNCHEDWEDVDWQTPPLLRFDGHGGTWDGSCYRGNFLRKF